MPFHLCFPTGDRGEARHPAVRQIVDPFARLRDCDQEGLTAARSDRRVMCGHVDDAPNGGRHRVPPGDGDRLHARDRTPGRGVACSVVSAKLLRRLLDHVPHAKLNLVRGQGRALKVAFDKVAITAGRLLPGTAGVEVMAQRCQDQRLKLGCGKRLGHPGAGSFFCSTAGEM